ncbi:MAG: DUF2461 domain-containing protein [Dokdonella sp.]
MTTYFSPAMFRFIRDLAKNNNREWFAANKSRYDQYLRQPYLQLIADLQAPLAKISTHFRADPRGQGGSLFRIYRDTRFANDKTPYKTWSGARFFHERHRELETPSFYLHLQPGSCFIGGGIWHPEPTTTQKIRDFLIDNPASWKKATRSKTFRAEFALGGESLTRPPRGFDAEHELIEDIKRKSFVASRQFDDAMVTSDELKPFIVASFKRVAPMVDYLCAAVDAEF